MTKVFKSIKQFGARPIFFLREQQLARKPDKDQIRLKGGRVASVGKNNR